MANDGINRAASVKQRLLNLARKEGRVYDAVLVRYALESLLYRLSISDQRDRLTLKGGMLVTLWIGGGNRETRDADFLSQGDPDQERLRAALVWNRRLVGQGPRAATAVGWTHLIPRPAARSSDDYAPNGGN